METTLTTGLHQKTSYHEFTINPKLIRLGTLRKTSWTLSPTTTYSNALFLDVTRTDTKGRFKIEGTLKLLSADSQPTYIFTKYIEDGQTNICLETKWTISSLYKYVEIRGHISISVCAIEDNPSALLQLSNPNALLPNDFLGLLNNSDSFPDATLICGTTRILVHKCILSSRSPVFAAMFKSEMQEGISGIVTIRDLEEDILLSTLKYMYSGKTDHISIEFAGDLLFAADKYQLADLKSICIAKLKSGMTKENVIRNLLLGNLFNRSLKDKAMEFIYRCNNFSEMEVTESWQLLKKQNPDLALEVLSSLVKYLQRN